MARCAPIHQQIHIYTEGTTSGGGALKTISNLNEKAVTLLRYLHKLHVDETAGSDVENSEGAEGQ